MKLLKKFILYIAIVLAIVLLAASSYFTYNAFKHYYALQSNTQLSTFLKGIDSTLETLHAERIESSLYLSTQAKSSLRKLISRRASTDKSLALLRTQIKGDATYTIYSIHIDDIYQALQEVRVEIDTLSTDYYDVLVTRYHQQVVQPFVEILEELSANKMSKTISDALIINQHYTALKENTVVENTFILFFVNASQYITEKDMHFWMQLLEKDTLPNLSSIGNNTLTQNIMPLMSPMVFADIASSEREMILNQSSRGQYSVSSLGWLSQTDEKMAYYTKVSQLIYSQLHTIELANIEESRIPFIGFSIATFIILLLLIKLLFMKRKKQESRQISTDTLRDIELVFNKDQQKELQRLMQQDKIDHIYKFLIQAIKDANTTKDLFLASMSHEIRTPLNGILGFTQLLKESDEKAEQAEFIAVIEKSSANLLTIVNDILDLSKIKAQKIELENIEFDPIDSFESAVESYAAKAAEENIDFNIFLDPYLPSLLLGDPTKISQIIVNLISNAVKFTAKNGEVNVSIEKLSESTTDVQVMFSVRDTGIGITDAQKENIFKAFTQADVSTSRKYGGTGLGLSISGKFVDIMGGKLEIKSIAGEGSTFYFTLQLLKPSSSKARDIPNLSQSVVGILNPHIGNEYIHNKNLEAYINATGAKIIHYTDESILNLNKVSRLPDILFIDHKSRHRGGELERFIHFDTKTILMSTGDQKRNLKHYRAQIDRILYKPINFSKTLKMLSNKEEFYESETNVQYSNVHILVAEDNLINQKLILNVLNRLGIKVTLANNGKEALDLRMQEEFDMIFMDIEMPVMGGMESTGKIINYEKHSGKKHTPIVTLTANALSGDREKYIGAGMDSYLSKPIELDALKKILRLYFEDRIKQH
ncbi:MAG: ATP-binding protein [Sulfurovum sp.]|nr:ATP-binding protein [Sulfurovum sp.]